MGAIMAIGVGGGQCDLCSPAFAERARRAGTAAMLEWQAIRRR